VPIGRFTDVDQPNIAASRFFTIELSLAGPKFILNCSKYNIWKMAADWNNTNLGSFLIG
jgi:hypothetical protein